ALITVLRPAPSRREPACPHFGTCGGCALQHMADDAYSEWKRGLVIAALAQRGFRDAEVGALSRVGPGTRRRASLKAMRLAGGPVLGFYARGSQRVVDVARCPVLVPGLESLIAPLRALLGSLLGPSEKAEIELSWTDTGADVAISAGREPTLADRGRLAEFAMSRDLARLCWQGGRNRPIEPVVERRKPEIAFGGAAVQLPPGAFLQPSAEGEARLIAWVSEAAAGAARIADLYSGCGTFALPLAKSARVHAVEGDSAMADALRQAAGRAGLSGRLTVECRDLERRPLIARELSDFDAVVFDPPRPGAKAQAAEIAKSDVLTVVAVSCNPATFARDARTLADRGFRLGRVMPLDQFLWSPHVELVAAFSREQRK
ncbi:MAG: class I SAM-dependent RNA methyltransferase, partial [Alphaproteobacteria bacterium]